MGASILPGGLNTIFGVDVAVGVGVGGIGVLVAVLVGCLVFVGLSGVWVTVISSVALTVDVVSEIPWAGSQAANNKLAISNIKMMEKRFDCSICIMEPTFQTAFYFGINGKIKTCRD
jgi:hypothetical protein